MKKLKRIETTESSRFAGYLDGAQHVFRTSELEITLEIVLLEISGNTVSDEDVINSAYPDDSNPIEYRTDATVDQMIMKVNSLLTIARKYWDPRYSAADHLEQKLRDGYWAHLRDCFDYNSARVVEVGYHVPYMNTGPLSFTYILYTADMTRCMVLLGNASD